MLTFAAGETEKTVSVPVIDDSHDESDETFTLTLSNASGGNAYLEDATATGTIGDDDEAEVPLTAEFRGFSVDAHDGSTAFTFELRFSEEVSLSYVTLRDHSLTVTNGQVKVRRLEAGKNQRWEITVEPDGNADVTITLPATTNCGDTGAICIGTRPLSAGASVTVKGPPSISVADARGTEGTGETVDFTVTLSRTASASVTVDYATSNGTATAGADYTSTSGTLMFAAGETAKTVSVPVIDDSHDEGEETFTLTLSNVSGANTYLSDATATGTIENWDPMPKAFLARFARASAVQVVEQVADRIRAPRKSGLSARFAGRELRPGLERGVARDALYGLAGLFGAKARPHARRIRYGVFPPERGLPRIRSRIRGSTTVRLRRSTGWMEETSWEWAWMAAT